MGETKKAHTLYSINNIPSFVHGPAWTGSREIHRMKKEEDKKMSSTKKKSSP